MIPDLDWVLPAVLTCVVERLTGLAVPHDRRLALVCDPYALELIACVAQVGKLLHTGSHTDIECGEVHFWVVFVVAG